MRNLVLDTFYRVLIFDKELPRDIKGQSLRQSSNKARHLILIRQPFYYLFTP